MRISLSLASLLLLLAVASAATAKASSSTTKSDYDPHLERVKNIFAWVDAAEDGFVSQKQSVRRMVEGDTNTPLVVYATQDIAKGELLVQTPWSHIITSDDREEDEEIGWHCGLVQKLANEMARGDESFYAPYTTYLLEEPDGQLPSQYSRKAKDLLNQVIGRHPDEVNRSPMFDREKAEDHRLMPQRLVDTLDDQYGLCPDSKRRGDKLRAKAASMQIQRADDWMLIPAYDAYNHRNNDPHNGMDYMNAETTTTFGQYHQTFANRDIQKGEQIFISYNMCRQCGARNQGEFGTAEMFREYGFVEWFPQRWWYPGFGDFDQVENENEINEFDLYQNEDTKDLTVVWTFLTKNKEKLDRFKVFLGREIRRLQRLKNIQWAEMYSWTEEEWKKSGISAHEWTTINQFTDANIVAMTVALADISRDKNNEDKDDTDASNPFTVSQDELEKLLNGGNHYDPLEEPEMDDLAYDKLTCDSSEFFEFLGYIDTENAFWTDRNQLVGYFESYFFNQNPDDVNVCFDLNNVVQMCSSFRPYGPEFMTHIAARYVESVKRVAFVGNGQSTLLHEILKYPDIELVVGLELDQTLTRKSFKHYKTDPYFHDPRVDWWFGDAIKSVSVLPESYWGSFDMVLIDLSEHTLDEIVTDDVNLFDSLAKLVDPNNGIMVNRDGSLSRLSERFDHSMDLFYEVPALCSESVIFGSNGIDFVAAPIYDHGVAGMGNLVYTTSPEGEARHNAVHDYRSKACSIEEGDSQEEKEVETEEKEQEQTTANGVIEFVTLEHLANAPESFESITNALKESIEGVEGFSTIANAVYFDEDQQLALVVMEEGYVAARMQKDENDSEDAENAYYLGFDIHLWSQIHRMEELKVAFLEAFQSKEVSSHKLFAGGMFGTKNWKEDAKKVGPMVPIRQKTCSTTKTSTKASTFDAEAAGGMAIEEALSLTKVDRSIVAVFCGSEGDLCTSLDVLKDHKMVAEVIPIYDCASATVSDDTKALYACEQQIIHELSSKLSATKKLQMFVLDSSASQQLHQIANSIFDTHENREAFLRWHSVAVSWSSNPLGEPWRREFLDRYRKQIHHDPIRMGEFEIVAGDNKSYYLGVVSTNDSDVTGKFDSFGKGLEKRLHGEAKVALRNMHGGLYKYVEKPSAKEFVDRDYDRTLGEKHFEKQVPLAIQTILQYEGNEQMKEQASQGIGMQCNFAEKLIYGATMNEGLLDDPSKQSLFQFTIGDGCVVLMIGKAFNAISVWDGRVHLDLNFFAVSTGEKTPSAAYVDMELRKLSPFVSVSIDAQPRGLGNIVNFAEDLVSIDRGKIASGLMDNNEGEQNPWY